MKFVILNVVKEAVVTVINFLRFQYIKHWHTLNFTKNAKFDRNNLKLFGHIVCITVVHTPVSSFKKQKPKPRKEERTTPNQRPYR